MATLAETLNNKIFGEKKVELPQQGFDDESIFKAMEGEREKLAKANKVQFPIEAFPDKTRKIIETFVECDGFPVEFYGLNVLVAMGALVGVGYKIKIDYGMEHTPLMYGVLVGDSSAGKGRSMAAIFRSVEQIEKNYDDQHAVAMEKYRHNVFQIKMTDAKEPVPPPPTAKELIMDDFTPEKLVEVMSNNPRGLVVIAEEILSWINNMNAYKQGSEEQFWIKNWDAAFAKISRKGIAGGKIFIKKTNTSVVGGIQPGVLHEMLQQGRTMTGFSARLLFAYPENFEKKHYNATRPHKSVYEGLEQIFRVVDNLPNRIEAPKTSNEKAVVEQVCICCTTEAKDLYIKYFNKLADENNDTDDDRIKGLIGKMVSYTARFALLLELLKYAEKTAKTYNVENDTWVEEDFLPSLNTWEEFENNLLVSKETMAAAIKLAEYFKYTGKKVLRKLETPVDNLKADQQAFYRGLPMEGIKWVDAKRIGARFKLSESTVQRLLNNTRIFKKSGQIYTRIYI